MPEWGSTPPSRTGRTAGRPVFGGRGTQPVHIASVDGPHEEGRGPEIGALQGALPAHGTQTVGDIRRHCRRQADAERFAKWLDALGPQGALDQLYETEQAADVPTLDVSPPTTSSTSPASRTAPARTTSDYGRAPGGRASDTCRRNRHPRPHRAGSQRPRQHYSHKSLENQRGLLSGVIDRAVELGHLPKNVAKGIRLPRGQEANRAEMRILTADEFDTVADRMVEHYRPLVRFLYATGCRWGEAVALQVQDVALYVDQAATLCATSVSGEPSSGHRTTSATSGQRRRRTRTAPSSSAAPCSTSSPPRAPASREAISCSPRTAAAPCCTAPSGPASGCRPWLTSSPDRASTTCGTPTPHGSSAMASRSMSYSCDSGTSRFKRPWTPTATYCRTRKPWPHTPPRWHSWRARPSKARPPTSARAAQR